MRGDIVVGATFPDYELPDHEYTDPQHDPMVPHTLVLEPQLKVFRIYNGYWYWGRPSVADLYHDLREVTRKIRPDWDLSDPDLRREWQAGEKGKFWPYGNSLKEVFASAVSSG